MQMHFENILSWLQGNYTATADPLHKKKSLLLELVVEGEILVFPAFPRLASPFPRPRPAFSR